MKCTIFLSVTLTLIAVNMEQTQSLQIETMDTYRTRINVENPNWNSLSSGILKSHSGLSYKSNRNKTLILSAPIGYGLLAAFRLLDLRPANQDTLTLYVDGDRRNSYTYSNTYFFRDRKYYPNEDVTTFYAPNGQLGVTFTTGPAFSTHGYDGFEFVYTVQANFTRCSHGNFYCDNGRCISKFLTCDGHNHCGDRSDQFDCDTFPTTRPGRIVAIVSGVVFIVAVASLIGIRRASRSRIQRQTAITHQPPPPSNNVTSYPPPPAYLQPDGTCYPPPPPPYSLYNEGITNPAYN